MLHIVLCADDNYVKFSSILITSIINNTNTSKTFIDYGYNDENEGYCFHILSDFISKDTSHKLHLLEKDLSKIYPTKIQTHIMSDEYFKTLKKWRGNYLAYYRIRLAHVLPKDLKRCLYLDSDMLVLQDIREITTVNIDNYTAAVILDGKNHSKRKYKKLNSKGYYYFDRNYDYFNSGFLYINLEQWKENHVEQRCFEFLNHYMPIYPDQDALNYAIVNSKKLPISWNLMVGYIKGDKEGYNNIFKEKYNIFRKSILQYTKDEFYYCVQNAKIIHFSLDIKPWHSACLFLYDKDKFKPIKYPFFNEYWQVASNVAYFNNDLISLKHEICNQKNYDFSKIMSTILQENRFITRINYRRLRNMVVILSIISSLNIFFIFFYLLVY